MHNKRTNQTNLSYKKSLIPNLTVTTVRRVSRSVELTDDRADGLDAGVVPVRSHSTDLGPQNLYVVVRHL